MPLYPTTRYATSGEQTYSGSVTWTGSAAPSATSHLYHWTRIGNRVFMTIYLYYASAGTALTALIAALPSGAPTPRQWTGKSAANLGQYVCDVLFYTADNASPMAIRTAQYRNTDELQMAMSSGNFKHAIISIEYVTDDA